MTDNEIIKALECCIGKYPCKECPYDGKGCEFEADALDLINRQKVENEELKAINESLKSDRPFLVAIAKAEAVKEFAEMLKSHLAEEDFYNPDERWRPESEFAYLIDIILKEMLGDGADGKQG